MNRLNWLLNVVILLVAVLLHVIRKCWSKKRRQYSTIGSIEVVFVPWTTADNTASSSVLHSLPCTQRHESRRYRCDDENNATVSGTCTRTYTVVVMVGRRRAERWPRWQPDVTIWRLHWRRLDLFLFLFHFLFSSILPQPHSTCCTMNDELLLQHSTFSQIRESLSGESDWLTHCPRLGFWDSREQSLV
jgi:hypothetical protein